MKNSFSKLVPSFLPDSALHIWQIAIDSTIPPSWLEVLSEDEHQRMSRLRQDRDKHRFGISRSALRFILAAYLNDKPDAIAFSYSQSGKPSLTNGRLQFSVSHSHDLALVALARSKPVGVDIEYPREDVEVDELSSRFFSISENGALQRLPTSERRAAFFRIWTAKEAFIKATGDGLSCPLTSFDVLLDGEGDPNLAAIRPDRIEKKLWTMRNLRLPDPYVGAVVTLGETEPPQLVEIRKSTLSEE